MIKEKEGDGKEGPGPLLFYTGLRVIISAVVQGFVLILRPVS